MASRRLQEGLECGELRGRAAVPTGFPNCSSCPTIAPGLPPTWRPGGSKMASMRPKRRHSV
eukprot:9390967-Pyramimonas_sp.AAC.1